MDKITYCKLCKLRRATVPDRNSGSARKCVCSECHSRRLRGDLDQIIRLEAEQEAAQRG